MQNNFLNTNEVYPILDLIRRQQLQASYASGDRYVGGGDPHDDDELIDVQFLREDTRRKSIVTTVVCTYLSGDYERITFNRDARMRVVGFLISGQTSKKVYEIQGTVIRTNGLVTGIRMIPVESR